MGSPPPTGLPATPKSMPGPPGPTPWGKHERDGGASARARCTGGPRGEGGWAPRMVGAASARRRGRRFGRVSRPGPDDLPPAAEPGFPRSRNGGRDDQNVDFGQRPDRPASSADSGRGAAFHSRLARGRPAGGQLGGLLRAHRAPAGPPAPALPSPPSPT